MCIDKNAKHHSSHKARRKSYILAWNTLHFEREQGNTRRLRSQGSRRSEEPLLPLCSAVLRFLSSTHHSDLTLLHIQRNPNKQPDSATVYVKDDTSDHQGNTKNIKSNAAQLHLLRFFFVHICIQLYQANLISLHVGNLISFCFTTIYNVQAADHISFTMNEWWYREVLIDWCWLDLFRQYTLWIIGIFRKWSLKKGWKIQETKL